MPTPNAKVGSTVVNAPPLQGFAQRTRRCWIRQYSTFHNRRHPRTDQLLRPAAALSYPPGGVKLVHEPVSILIAVRSELRKSEQSGG